MTSKLAEGSKNSTVTVRKLLRRIGEAAQRRSNPRGEGTQEPMSSTIKTLYLQLSAALKVKSLPPKAIKSAFQETSKLFGTNFATKVTLRDAGHLGANEDIILRQFDPNFVSTDVCCRHPSCGNKNPEPVKERKRDLYLCLLHRKNLITSIENTLAMRMIDTPKSTEFPEEEQFTGYTSFIGLLERAYYNSNKFGRFEKGKTTPMIEEAIRNVRNVLIINSTVLNTDESNLALLLPNIICTLRLVLENSNSAESLVADLVYFFRKVIEMILLDFGVIYRWVSLALHSPGLQIGAGLSGTIGLGVGIFFGPWGGAAGIRAGALLLTSSGIHNMVVGDPREQAINRFRQGRCCKNKETFAWRILGFNHQISY